MRLCLAILAWLVRSTLADFAFSLVLELFLFLLLLRQFFLTLFVSVVRCSQDMLSSYWRHFTISRRADNAFSISVQRGLQCLVQIRLQICHCFETD